MSIHLQGLRVLVTRPAHQATSLCELISASGGEAIAFPLIEITASDKPESAQKIIDQLDQYDMAVFISANAVEYAMQMLQAGGISIPSHIKLAAVGKGTAQQLQHHGIVVDYIPEQNFNSEGLLQLPALQQLEGKRIVIFRGDGGRELLAETLRYRGADVDYAEVYQRTLPAVDDKVFSDVWQQSKIDVIVLSSHAALGNLFKLVNGATKGEVCNTSMVVMSERMKQAAMQLGVKSQIIVVTEASNDGIVKALLQLTSCD